MERVCAIRRFIAASVPMWAWLFTSSCAQTPALSPASGSKAFKVSIKGLDSSVVNSGDTIELRAEVSKSEQNTTFEWSLTGESALSASFIGQGQSVIKLTLPIVDNCDDKILGLSVKASEGSQEAVATLGIRVSKTWCTFTLNDRSFPAKVALGEGESIWIGNAQGLSSFDGKSWSRTDVDLSDVSALFSQKGTLWVGSSVAWRFARDTSGLKLQGSYALESTIRDFALSIDGQMWVATSSGVQVLELPEGIRRERLIPEQHVNAIAVDGFGRTWLGTGNGKYLPGGGIYVFDRTHKDINDYKVIDGAQWGGRTFLLYNVDIHTLAIRGDDVYVGLSGGLARGKLGSGGSLPLDSASWKLFTQSDGIAGNNVRKVVFGQGQDIWIATGEGLSRFRPGAGLGDGNWETYFSDAIVNDDGFKSNNLSDLVYDVANDILWIASDQGVTRLRVSLLGSRRVE